TAGLGLLQSECRCQPTRHRSVKQASKSSALAAGVDVPKHPDSRRSVVGREQRVYIRMLVDDLGQVGARNARVGAGHRFSLRRCSVLLEALDMGDEETVIIVLFQARKQSLQGRLDIADRPDCDGVTSAYMG